MNRLNNKVAVITGGNSGIGLATAKEFISQGAKVVIAGRDEISLKKAEEELGKNALAIKTDVSVLSEIDNLYEKTLSKFGKIDILFANAGIGQFIPIELVSEEFFDKTMNINLKGIFFTIQKSLPHLNKNASLILTSSTVNTRGLLGASVYSASKAAVRSLARSFSCELAERGIRVNVLSPGPITTPIFGRTGLPEDEVKKLVNTMTENVPIKRFGSAEEMAKVVLFLASNDSSYLLGSEIYADGGFSQL